MTWWLKDGWGVETILSRHPYDSVYSMYIIYVSSITYKCTNGMYGCERRVYRNQWKLNEKWMQNGKWVPRDSSWCECTRRWARRISKITIYRRIREQTDAAEMKESSEKENSDWRKRGEERRCTRRVEEMRMKRRKETAEKAGKEVASSRMQDVDGFTWPESTRHRMVIFWISSLWVRVRVKL